MRKQLKSILILLLSPWLRIPNGTYIINAHDLGDGNSLNKARIIRNIKILLERGWLYSIDEVLSDLHQKHKVKIAFTFDDGFEGALFIADELARHNVRAIFFVTSAPYLGVGSRNYLDRFGKSYMSVENLRYLVSLGHIVGNHGHQHIDYSRSSSQFVITDYYKSYDLFSKIDCVSTLYFAFPFGKVCESLVEKLIDKNPNVKFFLSEKKTSILHRNIINRRHWELYEPIQYLKFYLNRFNV